MKIFIFLLMFIFLSSCSTIESNVFESHKDNVKSAISNLENEMKTIESLGEELYIVESSLDEQDILDIEVIRESPYEVNFSNPPFFFTIKDTISSLSNFNSFYIDYSNTLYKISSNELKTKEHAVSFNSSLKDITEELDVSDELINQSINASSSLVRLSYERFTYKTRINLLQDISKATSPLVIEIIDIYLDIIDDLEITLSDYYSRMFFHLENESYSREGLERRELNEELLKLSYDYQNSINNLSKLKNNFEFLKEKEEILYEKIINEELGSQDTVDFIIDNYEFYEELN